MFSAATKGQTLVTSVFAHRVTDFVAHGQVAGNDIKQMRARDVRNVAAGSNLISRVLSSDLFTIATSIRNVKQRRSTLTSRKRKSLTTD